MATPEHNNGNNSWGDPPTPTIESINGNADNIVETLEDEQDRL